MDPDAVWLVMHDETQDMQARADAADALVAWLFVGGFPPTGVTSDHALQVCGRWVA